MTEHSAVSTEKAPAPVGLYPHARRVGSLLFLSGVGPRLPGSNEIPGNVYAEDGQVSDYDIEAQCRSVFANVRSILEAAGSHWNDLVDVTVYLTDMKRDFSTFNLLYAESFADNQPCRTRMEINVLPTAIPIELKCIPNRGHET